jgi:hypothetical protein
MYQMNAKKSLLLLMLSSSYAHAMQDVNISHPGQLTEDFAKLQIHANPHQMAKDKPAQHSQTVRPPRTLSPVEFEKVQANIDALQHGVELDAQWTLDASKQYRAAQQSVMLTKKTQSTMSAAACTSPSQLLGLHGTALVDAVSNAQLSSRFCRYRAFHRR